MNWDVTEVKNHEELCFVGEGDDREVSPITARLIWATMHVGLSGITEKNWHEFYVRLRFVEDLREHPHATTVKEVRAHIGLRCHGVDKTEFEFLCDLKADLLERSDIKFPSGEDRVHAPPGVDSIPAGAAHWSVILGVAGALIIFLGTCQMNL